MRFSAHVDTTIEAFNVSTYARRAADEFDVEDVSVRVSSGSVVVTTEVPVDDGTKASDIALKATILAADAGSLRALYGASSVIDRVDVIDVHAADGSATSPPPSAPPPPTEEGDGTARAIIAVFLSLAVVVTALIIAYCVSFDTKTKPNSANKDYPSVAYAGAPLEASTGAKVRFRL